MHAIQEKWTKIIYFFQIILYWLVKMQNRSKSVFNFKQLRLPKEMENGLCKPDYAAHSFEVSLIRNNFDYSLISVFTSNYPNIDS